MQRVFGGRTELAQVDMGYEGARPCRHRSDTQKGSGPDDT